MQVHEFLKTANKQWPVPLKEGIPKDGAAAASTPAPAPTATPAPVPVAAAPAPAAEPEAPDSQPASPSKGEYIEVDDTPQAPAVAEPIIVAKPAPVAASKEEEEEEEDISDAVPPDMTAHYFGPISKDEAEGLLMHP